MTDPEKIQNLADRLLMAAGVAEGRGDTCLLYTSDAADE